MNLAQAKQALQAIIDETAAEVLDGLEQKIEENEATCEDKLGEETGEWVGDYSINFKFDNEQQGRTIVEQAQAYWEGRDIETRPAMLDGDAPRLYVEGDPQGLTYSLLVVMDTKEGQLAGNTGCRER